MSINPKTWPKWAWIVVAAALIVPLIIGARTLGAWPFEGPVSKVGEIAPPAFALQRDMTNLSGRVSTIEGTAASKADVSELRSELEKLRLAVEQMAGGKRKGVRTGSVK